MHAVVRVGRELTTGFCKVRALRQKRLHLPRLLPTGHKNLQRDDFFSPPRPRVGRFDVVLIDRDLGRDIALHHRVGEGLGFALGEFGQDRFIALQSPVVGLQKQYLAVYERLQVGPMLGALGRRFEAVLKGVQIGHGNFDLPDLSQQRGVVRPLVAAANTGSD